MVNCKGIKENNKEGDKRDEGYKKVNCLKVFSKKCLYKVYL